MNTSMHHGILVLLSLLFIAHSLKLPFKQPQKSFISIQLSKGNLKSPLYYSMITGDKAKIGYQLKRGLRQLGLLHLFTPSGLHLSSFFFIRFLPKKILSLLLVAFLIFLNYYYSYASMERVLIFKILHLVLKKTSLELHFALTFVLSFFLGQFQEPLSFLYSLLFWGTIIIFRKNPIKCLFYLNFQNLLLNSLSGSESNILIFILNPIITLVSSAFFPLIFFNSLLPSSAEFNLSPYFKLIEWVVNESSQLFVFGFSLSILLTLFISLKIQYPKIIFVTLLLLPTPVTPNWNYSSPTKFFLSPGRLGEQLKAYDFLDRKCNEYLNCRSKNIEWGGYKI